MSVKILTPSFRKLGLVLFGLSMFMCLFVGFRYLSLRDSTLFVPIQHVSGTKDLMDTSEALDDPIYQDGDPNPIGSLLGKEASSKGNLPETFLEEIGTETVEDETNTIEDIPKVDSEVDSGLEDVPSLPKESEQESDLEDGLVLPKDSDAESDLEDVPNLPKEYPEACKPYFDKSLRQNPTYTNQEKRFATSAAQKDIPKKIFFISYNQKLKSVRYLCSVESVMRQNPDHQVVLYTPFPQMFEKDIKEWRPRLKNPENLIIHRMNFFEVFEGTPLEKWFTSRKYEKSHWVDQNLGNAFRLGLLWKYGGTYLDLDIISVNPLQISQDGAKRPLGRFIAREESEQLNNAALRFPARDPFMGKVIEDFVNKFDGYTWAHNGPFCITRTFKKVCSGKISDSSSSSQQKLCQDLYVLDVSRFYPVHFRSTKKFRNPLSESCSDLKSMAENSFGLHWWHKGFEREELQKNVMPQDGMLGTVFNNECPNVIKAYGWERLRFSKE